MLTPLWVCLIALSSAEPFEALISGRQRVFYGHIWDMKIPNKIIECEICTKLALFRLQQVCIAIRFAGRRTQWQSSLILCGSRPCLHYGELRGNAPEWDQESRLKSKKEDNVNLLEEESAEAHSFAIYIIDNQGAIEDFYDVEDTKIGEGSFGRVCRCFNKSTGAERAVKMLRKVRRKSQLIMFKNELSTLKMLDHPHVVKLYEHFEDKRYMYMVMEFCQGGELFDRLLEVGNFSENQAAIIMQQIFRGVYYLHTMKIVHRDLKIENFMFAGEGPVEANMIKIIDFGFARSFEEGQFLKTKVGAPYFVSPQILAGKYTEDDVIHRSAQRCVRYGEGSLISVAMRIPKSVEEHMQKLCQRRFCRKGALPLRTTRQIEKQREAERVATVMDRNAGAAASERAEAAASQGRGDWFAGCVPLACLGKDEDLRMMLKMLFWLGMGRDLVGLEALSVSGWVATAELRVVKLFGPEGNDMGQGPYDVVAVTDKPERAHALFSSVHWPVRVRLLQPPPRQRPWKYRWFDTERYLLSYVTRLRESGLGHRLVIYADAFDTAFMGCQRDLHKDIP
eukprot:symbB.v1.2.010977.t2/scaffold725.1/size168906/3